MGGSWGVGRWLGGREVAGWEVRIPLIEMKVLNFDFICLFKSCFHIQDFQEVITRISSIFRHAYF